jgi:hypothetical protein
MVIEIGAKMVAFSHKHSSFLLAFSSVLLFPTQLVEMKITIMQPAQHACIAAQLSFFFAEGLLPTRLCTVEKVSLRELQNFNLEFYFLLY